MCDRGSRYVVTALHDTGHGEIGEPILDTDDLHLAITTARRAEELGYAFNDDSLICVSRLRPDTPVSQDGTSPIVFLRRKWRGNWDEEWYNQQDDDRTSPPKTLPDPSLGFTPLE
ncbi:hypothetical protein AMJ57_01565 [Parcubacteria bacterium SG8_24]|nr:MAG: hypothetical protein AMJ57_01565 [Parcubacteria bacterium SG8_24]